MLLQLACYEGLKCISVHQTAAIGGDTCMRLTAYHSQAATPVHLYHCMHIPRSTYAA